MTPRLKKSEVEELISRYAGGMAIGDKLRVNHDTDLLACSGGGDSAILERTSSGHSVYCFRCGGSGFVYSTGHFVTRAAHGTTASTVSRHSTTRDDSDLETEWTAWPREARQWLGEGGITELKSTEYGFGWSENRQALYIPVQQASKVTVGYKLVGHAIRGFSPKSYLTSTKDSTAFYGHYVASGGISDTVVLTEDVVSAIRVAGAGTNAIAMMGVHMKAAVCSAIIHWGYKQVVVFLDGDNPQVREKARDIVKRVSWCSARNISTGFDPKHYTDTALQDLLR